MSQSLVTKPSAEGEVMPKRDLFHDVVKNAMIKDGWVITHDPYLLRFGERKLYVDIGAEMPIAAEKDGRKIAVEVKTFAGAAEITDLERALGQYLLYSFLLEKKDANRALFLAIDEEAYSSLFGEEDGRELLASRQIRLMVFHPEREVILQWIE
jgi:XisH protein